MRRWSRSSTATSCGSASASGRRSSGHDDREVRREVAGAARVAGRLAAERVGDLADEGPSAVQSIPRRGRAVASSASPAVDLRDRLRPDPGHASRAARRPPPRATRRACGSRARVRARASASARGRADGATPTSSGSACASSSRSSASSPVSTSSAAGPRSPAPMPASSRTRPARTSVGHVDGRRPDQLGRPAVGAHGVVAPTRRGRAMRRRRRVARRGRRSPRLESFP